MKNLIISALAFFALFAAAAEPSLSELSPEKEAFLKERYETLKKSCAQKDARACKRVIMFYQNRPQKQNEKDRQAAMQTLLDACGEGKFDACAAAGEVHIKDKNFAAAREILAPVCDKGYQDACAVYGETFAADGAPDKDERKAQRLYETACNADSALGCEYFGSAIGRRNAQLGLEYLRKACDMDAWRCFKYGASAMPYGIDVALKALSKNCYETDMLAGCMMMAKYHEKDLAAAFGEAEVKRLHARLCELIPYDKNECEKAK